MTHQANPQHLPPAKSAAEYERLLRAAVRLVVDLESQVDLLLNVEGRERWTAEAAMDEIRKYAANLNPKP